MRISTLLISAIFLTSTVHAQSMKDIMNSALGGKEKVKVEEDNTPFEPLSFSGSYTWEIHSYKNDVPEKDSPMNLHMGFGPEHMAWIPETKDGKEEMRLVFDLKNKVNYTLITDKKGKRTGIKMKAMRITVSDMEDVEDDDDESPTQVVRTNETKVIEGHTCRKYTYKNDDGHGEAWIAEDIKFNAFEAMGNMVGARADDWQKAPYQGMVMESTWYSTSGKEKVQIYIRNLVVGKVDPDLFSTAGYEIQDMTNMPSLFGN